MTIFHYFETFEKIKDQLTRNNCNMTKSCMTLQNQAIESLQNTFATIFENANNMILNHQKYCSKLPKLYLILYAENMNTINKMFDGITFANANAFKNMSNFKST